MGAIVHSNVGLMHATMAVFNAWCDRAPLLLLGATGPVDATKRRPWIDWIHTAQDQGALIRHYTKWDDQPASVGAAPEVAAARQPDRATAPRGPIYSASTRRCRRKLDRATCRRCRSVERFRPPAPRRARRGRGRGGGGAASCAAERPVILVGRVARERGGLAASASSSPRRSARVVLTDLKTGAGFPTDHPLHGAPAGNLLERRPAASCCARPMSSSASTGSISAGALKSRCGRRAGRREDRSTSRSTSICTTAGAWITRACRRSICTSLAEPDVAVARAARRCSRRAARRSRRLWPDRAPGRAGRVPRPMPPGRSTSRCSPRRCERRSAAARPRLIRMPLSWGGHLWQVRHPLDILGGDGGGGVGSGPGTGGRRGAGAARQRPAADRDPRRRRLPDGQSRRSGPRCITASRCSSSSRNNRSFFNDELHQERMASQRGRPVANSWIGQHIERARSSTSPMMARGARRGGLRPRDAARRARARRSHQAIEAVARAARSRSSMSASPMGYDPATCRGHAAGR